MLTLGNFFNRLHFKQQTAKSCWKMTSYNFYLIIKDKCFKWHFNVITTSIIIYPFAFNRITQPKLMANQSENARKLIAINCCVHLRIMCFGYAFSWLMLLHCSAYTILCYNCVRSIRWAHLIYNVIMLWWRTNNVTCWKTWHFSEEIFEKCVLG